MSEAHSVVGRIRKPHGIRGDVIVDAFTDEPDAVFAPGRIVYAGSADAERTGDAFEVLESRPFKGAWLLALKGIRDRNEAERWRDVFLLARQAELRPPDAGELFLHELPGMAVHDADGGHVGTVVDVSRLPHGLLLEVRTDRGIVRIPFVDAIVRSIDRDGRRMVIAPPEGLLDLVDG